MSATATDGAVPGWVDRGSAAWRYLDAASGLPLQPTARTALVEALRTGWPDPTRRYPLARQSRRMLDSARHSLASALGVAPEGLILLGGFDEAVATALIGFPGRLLVSAVEDIAVLRTADLLQRQGRIVQIIDVDRGGRIDLAAAAAAAEAGPCVVVVQDVNIEIGTRQPIAALREAVGARTPLVVDVRATLGREPMAVHWDAAIAVPQLWGGPPGCSVLALRDPDRFRPERPPTDGQRDIEPASPSIPLAATAALALETFPVDHTERLRPLTRMLRDTVAARIPDSAVIGSADSAWITMFTFLYVAADELIDELARRGWSCASGASCTSDTRRPHHVLTAVGASTHGSLRVSLPPWCDRGLVSAFVDDLDDVVAGLRRDAGVTDL